MILILYYLPLVLSYTLHSIPEFGNPPTSRHHHSMVYDSSASSLLLFGGIQEGRGYLNDLWSYNLLNKEWSEIYPQSFNMPQPRSDFTMSIDSSDRKLYLFGGRTKIGISNEFWVYSIETKVWREIHGIGKPALNSSNVKSCIYTDESGYKYFILLTIQNNHFAIYKYSIDNNTWSMLANQGTIPPVRYGFSFECYNNSIIIWSGYPYKQDTFNPNTYLFYYKYNLDSESWSYPLPQGPPPPYRYLSGTCIYNNYLYIFYGYDPATMQDLDTISRVKLDESYQEWEDVRIDRSILDYKYIPRDSFQGVLVESYYYIFSGWNLHKIQNDFIRIELGKQYENREIVRLDRIHGEVIYPEGRIYASMQVFDNSLYVFGGLMQDESP